MVLKYNNIEKIIGQKVLDVFQEKSKHICRKIKWSFLYKDFNITKDGGKHDGIKSKRYSQINLFFCKGADSS